MALIECPVCGRKIADRARMCSDCGTVMEEIKRIIEERNRPPKVLVCPECGAEVLETEEECPNCLLPIEFIKEERQSAEPEVTVYLESVKCAVCGSEYAAQEMVCPECGYPAMVLCNELVRVRNEVHKRKIEVYLNELMAKCGVNKIEDLALCDEPFDCLEVYTKILNLGDESIKAELKGYINCIDERKKNTEIQKTYNHAKELAVNADTEEAYFSAAREFESVSEFEDADILAKKCYETADIFRRKRIYIDATELMKSADTEEVFIKAAKGFESIPEYGDAKDLAEKCYDEAERCRIDEIYSRAKNMMSEQGIASCEEAIKLFKSIPGWKDSEQLINSCKNKIDELKLLSLGNMKIGEIIKFGRYEQGNGIEPIEWQVLDKQDNKLLVISRYALDCKKYNEKYKNITWEKCTLRNWLNTAFLNAAFNDLEQSVISDTLCTADKDIDNFANPGNDTEDKIFLLSMQEAEKYFKSKQYRQCAPTDNAITNGVWISNEYIVEGKGACNWWLRSSGFSQHAVASVYSDGSVFPIGYDVNSDDLAVRPALWITLTEYDKAEIEPEDESSTSELNIGTIVEFGNYRAVSLEWKIIEQRSDRVLLISQNAIELRKYNEKHSDVTWETCDLRKWLNSTFLNQAFIDEERKLMVPSIHIAEKNPKYDTSSGNNTQDNIFLLSISEVEKYFPDNKDRICYQADNEAACSWWLRTPGVSQSSATNVSSDGTISSYGLNVDYNLFAVRPAVWVRL